MAKTFKLSRSRRLGNSLVVGLLRLGLPMGAMVLLTVRGRKSGKEYQTPVSPMERDNATWLVAPYGEVAWVRNLRVAGEARLTRGRKTRTVQVTEASPVEAAPVLKQYLNEIGIVRPYFDVTKDASLDQFEKEAPRHPVFKVVG
ncbi:MAG: nitroreductase family deazaflavin-dependent oxidoreductase [Chloroflexi bacterium]|nr:nitroreductase family deazaflavin-dependent oxidoreductase [Chloroflexota bacterium]OJW02826.1 MAG: hypothetical protein BGO39_06280 [Chloroflexi bacterium 54-19]